jgi:Flp pilus assembly protein protease CpaA
MHLIAGWPMLSVLFVAILSVATLADSRSRGIVNWVVLPVLLEGAVLYRFYMIHP